MPCPCVSPVCIVCNLARQRAAQSIPANRSPLVVHCLHLGRLVEHGVCWRRQRRGCDLHRETTLERCVTCPDYTADG